MTQTLWDAAKAVLIWVYSNTILREGNGTPLQYSCLENPMDGGAWKAAVHGATEGQTWLSDFAFTFPFHALEKEMATHSSVLAWRIPRTGEPGGLPSMGSHRVGHNWNDLAAAAAVLNYITYFSPIFPFECLEGSKILLILISYFLFSFFLPYVLAMSPGHSF